MFAPLLQFWAAHRKGAAFLLVDSTLSFPVLHLRGAIFPDALDVPEAFAALL